MKPRKRPIAPDPPKQEPPSDEGPPHEPRLVDSGLGTDEQPEQVWRRPLKR